MEMGEELVFLMPKWEEKAAIGIAGGLAKQIAEQQ